MERIAGSKEALGISLRLSALAVNFWTLWTDSKGAMICQETINLQLSIA
jgi:hypothetical protein